MCSSAHQICDMWDCNAQERGSERYREEGKDKERERTSGRRRSAVSSGHAWIQFAYLPQSVQFYANTDTHTHVHECVCVFSCAYSTIVTDYLLSTCFGSHHLGTASSLGVELWRCTQLAAAATRQCDMCDTCLKMRQEGKRASGRVNGFKELRWVREKCHSVTWGTVWRGHNKEESGRSARCALVRAAARLPKTSNGLLIN